MDFAAAIVAWVEANPGNPLEAILLWLADIIKFIASL